MRWLLSGKLTPAVAEALRRHGHHAQAMAEVGIADDALPVEIFTVARRLQLDLITDDPAIADAPFSTPFGRSVVYLHVASAEVEQDDAVDRLFQRYARLSPGRLYTVTAARVKVRQLPGAKR